MLNTSQDVLYLTVAICVAFFTVFLIWIMYYIAQITKQSNEMVTDFRNKMEELDQTAKDIKDKVSNSMESLTSISDQIKTIFGFIKTLRDSRLKRSTKK